MSGDPEGSAPRDSTCGDSTRGDSARGDTRRQDPTRDGTWIEDLVAEFLDRRATDPDLSPTEFALQYPTASDRLLPALRGALDVLATLQGDPDPPPAHIGPYRVLAELGRGGMGVVYRVQRDGATWALKRLAAASLLQPHAQQRLLREARALQRIAHPGIVAVHDVGTTDGQPYLVMDLVDGASLADAGPLPWRRAVDIVRQLSEAVATLHAAGLWHRDLKPHNVLLRGDGKPILIDFGLVHDEADASLTRTGDLVGTPRYLAPEQALGRPADARSDVHALGLILAELLTGAPVRGGDDRSALLLAARRRAVANLDPALGLPPAIQRVLDAALAEHPHRRIPTAAALADDLARLLADEPVRATPPGRWVRVWDWGRAHPRAGATAVVALTLGAVGAAVLAWQAHRASTAHRAQVVADVGLVAWVAQDHRAAADAARSALAIDPDCIAARTLLRLEHGDQPLGATPLAAALSSGLDYRGRNEWHPAAAAFARASQLAPREALCHVLRAEAAQHSGDAVGAVADLANAARLLPDSAPVAAALGAAHYRAGDRAAAAREYRRAIAMQPRWWHLHYQLARACYGVDAAAGLAALEEAERRFDDPDPTRRLEILNLRASLLDTIGKTGESIAILRDLVEAAPQDPRFAFNLAYALDRSLAVAQARPWYERVLELQPTNLQAKLCLVWLHTTAAQPELRDVDKAERLLREALAHDRGQSASVLSMLREFGLKTGRIDALADDLQELAGGEDLPDDRRESLRHTRSYLLNAVPRDSRDRSR